jgi:hypothetical protein
MNADKDSASQAQDEALDRHARVAEVQQQAEVQARTAKVIPSDEIMAGAGPPSTSFADSDSEKRRWSAFAG